MARKAPLMERMSRRMAIFRGRATHSFAGRGPRHASLFFHLPKCGGTSLSEAMYATIPFNHRIGVIDAVATRRAAAILNFDEDDKQKCHEDLDTGQLTFDLREGMLLQHMAWDTMLIHGHVFWSDRAWTHFSGHYKYVTIMRDPMERMVSNFRMCQRSGIVTEEFDQYLEGPIARRHAQVYLRYLAGSNDIPAPDVASALQKAHARLDHFALIGFLDRTAAFQSAYKDLFGVRLRLPKLNAAPSDAPKLTEDQTSKIRDLCAPDYDLYEAAKARFS